MRIGVQGQSRTMQKNYLLKLIPPVPFGRWISGILLLALLSIFFSLTTSQTISPVTLFFTLIISYIIPIYSFISEKSEQALDDLREELTLSTEEFTRIRLSITHSTFTGNITPPLIGFAIALIHQWFIFGTFLAFVSEKGINIEILAGYIGTFLIWITMSSVIRSLVSIARIFSKLGKNHTQIDLHQTHKLVPFARVAIISTLALIGALALFPILLFDSDMPLLGALPGFIATGIPIFIMLAIPVWPIHRRLLQAKEQALAHTRELISDKTENLNVQSMNTETIVKLAPLLAYQRSLIQISTWPFDLGAITRLTLYLIIPPITWVGAALIEKGLESIL